MGNEYIFASPLILIFVFSIVNMLIDAVWHSKKAVYYFSIAGLFVTALYAAYSLTATPEMIASAYSSTVVSLASLNLLNMITIGGYAAFMDIIFCIAAILTLLAARPYIIREYDEYNEFYSMILFSVSGMMFIAHSDNLLLLFIGIEIMSISFYVLAGYFRKRPQSVEAALKYFLLGSFATGFLLYGIAMVYGATGSLDLSAINQKILTGVGVNHLYLNIGLGLLIVGLCFKIAAFPFHQWAPDVYHGSPTVISGFMSAAGKAAAIIAFVIIAKSLIITGAAGSETVISAKTAQLIIAVISAATMLIGNFTALIQKNVKRMLSYSSVAHAGYLLMGIAANNQSGMNGILFYSAVYMFMQIGAFVVASVLERNDTFLEITDYAGLRKSYPLLSAVMAMFMFSLAGIPPFAGFFGKYLLFIAAVEAGYTWLTVVAVISSIISMYFYIGLIIQMYFKEPEAAAVTNEVPSLNCGGSKIALTISAFAILLFGILPSLITKLFVSSGL